MDKKITVIAVHGMNPTPVDEYRTSFLGQKLLSKYHYQLILPDFHSGGKEIAPGKCSYESFNIVVESIMMQFQDRKFILMGKSWGGKMSVNFAIHSLNMRRSLGNKSIDALILIAPAGVNDFSHESLKVLNENVFHTLLLYAKDDKVVGTSDVLMKKLDIGHLSIYTVETGKHRIFEEYAEIIGNFLSKIY